MEPPVNTALYETALSVCWFDRDGILCCLPKGVLLDRDTVKGSQQTLLELISNRKICVLMDVTHAWPLDVQQQGYVIPGMSAYKALALVSGSPLGRKAIDRFIRSNDQGSPVKMFPSEKEARQWLKQYL